MIDSPLHSPSLPDSTTAPSFTKVPSGDADISSRKEGNKQRAKTWTGAEFDQCLCLHAGVSSLIGGQRPAMLSAPTLFPRARCVYAFEPTNLSLA